MNVEKWIKNNCKSLKNKKIVISGATGGLGRQIVFILASLEADLVFFGKDYGKTDILKEEILSKYPNVNIDIIDVDLSSMQSVKECVNELKKLDKIDVLIHNAGIYNVPLIKTDAGYNNVFQVNFVSPYYITKQLLPIINKSDDPKVIAVGSIAHNYSKIDENDIDFSTRKKSSKIYGNSKRFLMFSLYELFKDNKKIKLSICHPGITFTNITNHYPKFVYAIIKNPMKIIFMSPKKACLSIIKGIFDDCDYHEWIGPKIFGIWGQPKKSNLKTCSNEESEKIFQIAEKIYNDIK